MREGGNYLVSRQLARIRVPLQEVDVDLSSAFIVLPQAIEAEAPAQPATPGGGVAPMPPDDGTIDVVPPQSRPPQSDRPTTVRLTMRVTRQQVYATTNAIGNLAQAAGTVRITVEATKLDGFDRFWLHGAVLEPLDEADVDVEQ